MKIVIVGGGISAVHIANNIKNRHNESDVLILSDENINPYDRIHLCSILQENKTQPTIFLDIQSGVKIELNQKIITIDKENKKVYSKDKSFAYDKLIICTGSSAKTPFDISNIKNATVFRGMKDCEKINSGIENRKVVIVGAGPISLELLDSLNKIKEIILLIRKNYLYDKNLSFESKQAIENHLLKNKNVQISYEDEIIEKEINNNEIISIKTKKLSIDNPFLIFGIGIEPNIEFARNYLSCDKGILTNAFMQSEDENIYAVGEAAQIKDMNFVASHVKECTLQANTAIKHIFDENPTEFYYDFSVYMLKVKEFDLVEVKSSSYDNNFEKVILTSKENNRIDEYFLKNNKLIRFVGINSNIDIEEIEILIQNQKDVDLNDFYQNRLVGKRGKLVCICEHMYYNDLIELIHTKSIKDFSSLKNFSQAGRVCGRCRAYIEKIISQEEKNIIMCLDEENKPDIKTEEKIELAKKRIEKYNTLHPSNELDEKNLESALESFDYNKKELNKWVSMVTATMQLHPDFEQIVNKAIVNLNKIPIIWLELSDCSGNSEAFVKSTNPNIEELIFDYISLDYHELLMTNAGNNSETLLDGIIKNKEYILIVEGAVPLGLDGKFLRIGAKGETGLALLERCAKDASMVVAVGSCAFDGGVVAAYPNPTQAVGVAEALKRDDVINISGCPANPINIVGTLLYYLMFGQLPTLDKDNRPLWAYGDRIHDNCERRGHYELGEFVKEWGDEGAKRGWCLFEMGCKGPFAFANCPLAKFNQSTSWPVQVGHGCMACVEKNFFDKYANERKKDEKNSH